MRIRIQKVVAMAVAIAALLGGASMVSAARTTNVASGKPGTLISAHRIAAPRGAQAWRIRYRSTTSAGKRVVVSGMVVAPTGKAPRKGRPVLAWAHGTTGVTNQCAPSTVPNPARNLLNYFSYQSRFGFDAGVPALTTFLKAGYVIAATDYQGLGTPGVHQYSVGGTEARNVLDSVKAAHQLARAGAGLRTVVLGWSEGGGAALWVGQDTAYGVPVRVLGSAALAPNADLYQQFVNGVKPGPTNATAPSHEAALRLALYKGLQAAYPHLHARELLLPPGVTALGGLANQCIEHFADTLLQTSVDNGWGLDPTSELFRPIPPPKPWARALRRNTLGYASTHDPVLVMQGTADTVINPNATAQYVARACRFKQPVLYTSYPNQTHQTIPAAARRQYVRWIAGRFASTRAPTNCPRH
jgi:alpha-beta hydrolase superfamily lysophospholipase